MTWKPGLLNHKSRIKAVLKPQKDPKDCVPYWWRHTDDLVPVIIKPTAFDLSSRIMTFDVYDTAAEAVKYQDQKVFVDDETGTDLFTDLPSTVMEWVREYERTQDTSTWCLALFTGEFAFTRKQWVRTVEVTGEGEGKWPRTAGLLGLLRLQSILDELITGQALSPADREFLKLFRQELR